MAITYITSTDRPGDNSTQGGNIASPLLISAAGATTGDLIVVIAHYRGNATIQVGSEKAGQTWNSLTQFNDANNLCAVRVFWCRWNAATYNGNNPNFEVVSGSSSIAFSTVAHIFRPTTSSNTWDVDNVLSSTQFSAPSTPFTVSIAGVTPSRASSVAIAGWFSEDDNTWGSLSGTGWSVLGDPQYRNTTGNDMSSSYGYKIQTSSAATGNVSKNQATLGGDAGATFIVSFYEASSGAYALPVTTGSFSFTGITAGLKADRKVTLSVGTFSFTGKSTGLNKGYKIPLSVGSFTFSGLATSLMATRKLPISPGSYTHTGVDARLIVDRSLSAVAGTFIVSDNYIGLSATRPLAVGTGAIIFICNDGILNADRSLLMNVGVFNVTRNNAGALAARQLSASTDSYLLTGTNAGLLADRKLQVQPDSYIANGIDLQLLAGRKLTASQGIFIFTGIDANLDYSQATGFTLFAGTGSFTLAGINALLKVDRIVAANVGTYSLTGTNTLLKALLRLIIDRGIYTLTANIAGLFAGRRLPVATGAYVLSGKKIGLLYDFRVFVDPALFDMVGQDAELLIQRYLQAGAGSFVLIGFNTNLITEGIKIIAITGEFTFADNKANLKFETLAEQIINGIKSHHTGTAAGDFDLSGIQLPTIVHEKHFH